MDGMDGMDVSGVIEPYTKVGYCRLACQMYARTTHTTYAQGMTIKHAQTRTDRPFLCSVDRRLQTDRHTFYVHTYTMGDRQIERPTDNVQY